MLLAPDPSRPIAPILPAELLARILKLAQAGDSISDQFETRRDFELVARDWYECDFKWRVVVVKSIYHVSKLVRILSEHRRVPRKSGEVGGEPGLPVKAIRIEIRGEKGASNGAAVAGLLRLVPKVEHVELHMEQDGLGDGGRDALGVDVTKALAKLEALKSFALCGPIGLETTPRFSYPAVAASVIPTECPARTRTETDASIGSIARRLVAHWPALKSLALRHCRIDDRDQSVSPFGPVATITSLELCGLQFEVVDLLLAQLPPSLRSLKLIGDGTSAALKNIAMNLYDSQRSDQAMASIQHLTSVTILDRSSPQFDSNERALQNAYLFVLRFVAELKQLTRLVINPWALGDVGLPTSSLMPSVIDLDIIATSCALRSPVRPSDLVNFLKTAPQLKRVRLPAAPTWGWSDEQRAEVEALDHIAFTWTPAPPVSETH